MTWRCGAYEQRVSDSPAPEHGSEPVGPENRRAIDLTETAAAQTSTRAVGASPGPLRVAAGLRRALLVAVVVVGLGALYWFVTLVQVVVAADDDEARAVDAIVVLGAAQFDGTPSPVLAARLDRALALYRSGQAELIITTGSNQEGDRFTEGFSGFVYLREAGVPEEFILNIVDGADTYQQLTAAQAQLVERGLDSVLLVSDGYHTKRLRGIADEIDLEAWVAPTGIEASARDYVREATAVSIGRIVGYRRLSAWNTG